jgi:large subunit ribosomal protein L31
VKKDIHPNYVECTVKCSCGNTFTTKATKPELRIDICNECHPFYTGTQKLIDTGGRVQRFADRFGSAATVAAREAEKKAARAAEIAAREAEKKAAREAKAAAKSDRAAKFAAEAEKAAAEAAAAAPVEAPAEAAAEEAPATEAE